MDELSPSELMAAAEGGNAKACNSLGWAYVHGDRGIPRDPERARFWLLQAAQLGDADCQYDLACCLFEGEGPFERETESAVEWCRKAADQGHRRARFEIATRSADEAGSREVYLDVAADWFQCLDVWEEALQRLGLPQADVEAYVRWYSAPGTLSSYDRAKRREMLARVVARGGKRPGLFGWRAPWE